jgi:glycosyltransferase involved in cell wall biosynthesis
LKKIAFVSTNKSSWGGSEYLWYYSSFKLAEKGYELRASVPRWKEMPPISEKLKSSGIKLEYLTDVPAFKKLINRFVPASFQFKYNNEGFLFLLDFKPDLVVINQGGNTGGIDLMEYCILNNLKFVTIANAANEAKWPSDLLNERLSKALPKAEVNYFVSNANIHLTEIQIGQKIENAKLIVNPFNVEYEYDIEYPKPAENYFLASVARMEFYAKGQDILLKVLNEKKWRERNLIVNLYGKGEHVNSVNKLIKYFDIKKTIMKGHVRPAEIWRDNHALILTSRYEGLPLALIEAMLCKRMGIVTNVSGNPEVVIDNENGFLAKAALPEFVDEAMERAWNRRTEWEEIGKKANQFIKTIVPADPIGVFCNEIESLLSKKFN